MRQYLPHVLADLDLLRATRAKERSAQANAIDLLIGKIDEAHRWNLTPSAAMMLWLIDSNKDVLVDACLPYDTLWLEYEFPYKELGGYASVVEGNDEAPHRCVLINNVSDEDWLTLLEGRGSDGDYVYEKERSLPIPPLKFAITVFWKISKKARAVVIKNNVDLNWLFVPYSMVLSSYTIQSMDKWMDQDRDGYKYGRGVDSPMLAPLLCKRESYELLAEINLTHNSSVTMQSAVHSLMDEVFLALSLLSVLATKQAPLSYVSPPEKLNKKRAKTGKRFFKDYHVLNITSPSQAIAVNSGDGTGHHRSPKVHWRRGFVRNQWYPSTEEHKPKLIKPVLVGSGIPDHNPTKVV